MHQGTWLPLAHAVFTYIGASAMYRLFMLPVAAEQPDSTEGAHVRRRPAPGWWLAVVAALAVSVLAGLASPSAYSETMDSMEASSVQHRFDIESIESRVQSAVLSAVILYGSEGAGAFETITPETKQTGTIYPFVLDAETLEPVANGAFPNLDGVIPDTVTLADRPAEDILSDLRLNGTWVEYMATNPNTDTVQLKRAWLYLHDGYIFGSGHYLFESGIQAVVDEAVAMFNSEGRAAFDAITPDVPALTDALYPFVLNFTTSETVAHGAYPDKRGAIPISSLYRADRPWSQIQQDLLDHGSTWASYVFTNPNTGTDQLKRTWLYLHDGYIFASGYYLQDSRVQSLVEEAVHLYASQGTDAFEIITPEPGERLGSLVYSFVLETDPLTVRAHSGLPDRVGTVDGHLSEADKSLSQIRDELDSEEGTWVAYLSENPNTRTDQLTRTYLAEYDGYIFGAGYYFPDSRIQSVVDEAIYAYRSHGDAAFETISSGDLNTGNLWPIVRNSTHVVAYGLVGPAKELGFNYQRLLGPISEVLSQSDARYANTPDSNLATAKKGGTTFTSALNKNPSTQTEQIKISYGALHDGYIFSSAYAVPDADAQSVVDYALFIYESNKENDAWVDIITPDDPVITDDIYPFVMNATTWKGVAHGVLPDRIGVTATSIQETSVRPFEAVRADLDEDGSAWVTYTFLNPDTGTNQLKRTWLVERDGYIFAAGYYIFDSRVQTIAYDGTLDFDQLGRDAAFAKINVVPDKPNSLYLFVVDPGNGTVQAQGVDPSSVGSSSDWQAALVAEPNLLNKLETENGEFVTYQFLNPTNGQVEPKRTWLTMHEGYVFGAGYYPPDPTGHAAFMWFLFG